MFIKKLFLLILILIILPLSGYSKEKSERLFIKTFETKKGISKETAEKFRDKLVLYFFQEEGERYRVLSEDDIKIMYQQAEELLKIGCNAEECLMQIAYTIDADIIIYGKMEKSEGKINVLAQSLVRNRETDELVKKSIVNKSFYESQMNWYAREIVKKLINSDYFVDENKAPLEIKIEIAPELLKTTKLKTRKLKVLKFAIDDTALQTIMNVLKDIVLQGDDFYQKKDITDARLKYEEVIEKIETKVSGEKQKKLADFKKSVYDRISATYSIELQEILKAGDDYFENKNYHLAFSKYKEIGKIINDIEYVEVRTRLIDFINTSGERMDLVRINYAKKEILKGDSCYADYQFEKAIEFYDKAIRYLVQLRTTTNKKYITFSKDLKNKKEVVRKTGISYFRNQVKSYRDKVEVYNIKDETWKAKEMLLDMYDLINASIFADYESRNILEETSALLNLSVDEIEMIRAERIKRQEELEEAKRKKAAEEELRKAANKWHAKKIIIDLEFGAGHLLNGFFSYKLGLIGLGVGGAYDIGSVKILGKEFKEHLFNIVGILNIHLIKSNFIWLDLRGKFGNEWIKIDKYSEKGTFLSTDMLIGYRGFYGEVSVPVFFGKEGTAILVQIGLGYRIKI